MFDIETAMRDWHAALQRERTMSPEALEELDDHLRAEFQWQVTHGHPPAAAFAQALARLGTPAALVREFEKVEDMWWRRLVVIGWLLYAVSFALPAHAYGMTLFDFELGSGVIPGIEAFLFALKGEAGIFGMLSALTNFAMLATAWSWPRHRQHQILLLTVITFGAAVLNGWWLFTVDTIGDLRIGYFTWWASFMIVGSGLALRARAVTRTRRIAAVA